jgi:hypothetical protein
MKELLWLNRTSNLALCRIGARGQGGVAAAAGDGGRGRAVRAEVRRAHERRWGYIEVRVCGLLWGRLR